jgi:branched-chain amino acid transport system ATP-binding protein
MGAEKTTFFNLLSGFYLPTSGKVLFQGKDITKKSMKHVSQIGTISNSVPECQALDP